MMEEPYSIEIEKEFQKFFAFHMKNDYFPTFHTNPNSDVFQFEHCKPQECGRTLPSNYRSFNLAKKEKKRNDKSIPLTTKIQALYASLLRLIIKPISRLQIHIRMYSYQIFSQGQKQDLWLSSRC